MRKTIVISKRMVLIVPVVLLLAIALVAYSLLSGLPGGSAKQAEVAKKLAAAEANGELYSNLNTYADLMTPELMQKLQIRAAQVLPQMQAIHFQSRLVSIEGTEVKELEDGQYQVLVRGKVEVQGDGIPQQVREGTATVTVAEVNGRWLATGYKSFGSE